MSSAQLVERASLMIRDSLKQKMPSALSGVRTDRADAIVSTPVPGDYFFYESAAAYRTPAVFIIAGDIDFRKEELGANFVDATIHYNISVVIEDRSEDYLTIKAWRYQAALYECLDQVALEDTVNNVKVTTVVKQATFSPIFTTAGTAPNNFRKEIVLECDAYQYENFQQI